MSISTRREEGNIMVELNWESPIISQIEVNVEAILRKLSVPQPLACNPIIVDITYNITTNRQQDNAIHK